MEGNARGLIKPLKPSGNYMYHLLYELVIVRSVFMSLDVNSDYFLEQR
jgi:hypothetical protein